jgi:hypothetical protein
VAGRQTTRSVRQAAHRSCGLKSHPACDHKLVSKGGSNVSPADRDVGGQGVQSDLESGGYEENHRVVIDGGHPDDEPVGQR